jgi:hypothetical protein
MQKDQATILLHLDHQKNHDLTAAEADNAGVCRSLQSAIRSWILVRSP